MNKTIKVITKWSLMSLAIIVTAVLGASIIAILCIKFTEWWQPYK